MTTYGTERSPCGLRTVVVCVVALITAACGSEGGIPGLAGVQSGLLVRNDTGEQQQGPVLNDGGEQQQGPALASHVYDGASLGGRPLANVHVEDGELVAELDGAVLRGTALAGAVLSARVVDAATSPPTVTWVEHRIAEVQPELEARDRAPLGRTFLYTVEKYDGAAGAWVPFCQVADPDGLHVAIPIAAVWDERANRVESATEFTFACTTGAIGKCYRWGYRPWLSAAGGPEGMRGLHQACVRMARADYCGDGVPHTRTGTRIMIWDTVGPFQTYEHIPGFAFEAGWGPGGAVCMSHERWRTIGQSAHLDCPDRLIPPGSINGAASVCDDQGVAGTFGGGPSLFNASALNLAH